MCDLLRTANAIVKQFFLSIFILYSNRISDQFTFNGAISFVELKWNRKTAESLINRKRKYFFI